ncbi:MAG: THUMP domain-containing protein [Candidatus Methanomethylicia archaeon]|nr:THUMP domain-containing protein [Candidatus Methanomethylicia archaeon]MDW7988745.1 THUMP domain-containing protein [Nitrososphaerota archaeon]
MFFRLSCEHESLPAAEVKAILEAERIPHKFLYSPPCIFRVSMPIDFVNRILNRSSMVFFGAKELLFCDADEDLIFRLCRDIDWSFLLTKSFCVRVKRIFSSSMNLSTKSLESEIGRLILNSLNGASKVNLDNPDVTLIGVLSGGKFVFGILLGEVNRGKFFSRWAGIRPFIHPSSLDPIISRLFVNLCRARSGGIFFDPFCGFGGFLIEAALIGCRVIGLDIDKRMLRGCMYNMRFFNLNNFDLVMGDARYLPFKCIDYVATDPPYGRTASTKGVNLKNLIFVFLSEIYTLLSENGYICLATPNYIGLSEVGFSIGFKLIESHIMKVHKNLIREICVFSLCR